MKFVENNVFLYISWMMSFIIGFTKLCGWARCSDVFPLVFARFVWINAGCWYGLSGSCVFSKVMVVFFDVLCWTELYIFFFYSLLPASLYWLAAELSLSL